MSYLSLFTGIDKPKQLEYKSYQLINRVRIGHFLTNGPNANWTFFRPLDQPRKLTDGRQDVQALLK